ncbi:MAG: hypothetical protein J2P46_00385 [Zavarzinella sp.]|nr:hypothetical protein [Zavarzinella sp.]
MTFYYAWWVQLVVTLLFAAHLARMARRRGRHPFGAALLMLVFANGWPLVFEAVGGLVSAAFTLKETPRTVLVRVFGYGGVMFGVAVSYAIVGCMKPAWPARKRDGRGAA